MICPNCKRTIIHTNLIRKNNVPYCPLCGEIVRYSGGVLWCKNGNEKHLYDAAMEGIKNDDPDSMFDLGWLYDTGRFVEQNYMLAFKYYFMGAEREQVRCQSCVAYMYYNGDGVERNESKTFYWFKRAADQGWHNAELEVGQCFFNGIGTEINYELAFVYWLKAANGGENVAQYNVGLCYKNGIGVDRNLTNCRKWLTLAAENGHQEAKLLLSSL